MSAPDRKMANRTRFQHRFVLWLGVACLVVFLDQATKWLALKELRIGEIQYVAPFFNWALAFNTGAAFSFLASGNGWQRWFLSALALGVSVWIVRMLKQGAGGVLASFALSLILGGALGNVIDRISIGAVVDFIQWHIADYYWPAFNGADSAITLGAALLIWDQFASGRANNAKADPS